MNANNHTSRKRPFREFGELLAKVRKQRGLKLKQVSINLGKQFESHRKALYRYENGERPPDREDLLRMMIVGMQEDDKRTIDKALRLAGYSKAERAQITARGSIDDPTTRDAACNILEGSKEAFNTRAKIYGIR